MLFDVLFLVDLSKIREYIKTDTNIEREKIVHIDWDYQSCEKVLLQKDGTSHKTENQYESNPWSIT